MIMKTYSMVQGNKHMFIFYTFLQGSGELDMESVYLFPEMFWLNVHVGPTPFAMCYYNHHERF